MRRGFFGRGKLQPLSQNDSTGKTVVRSGTIPGKEYGDLPPCHSEQAVFNKNTNMKPW